MTGENWKIMPVEAGRVTFYVLIDEKGRTKAQGRRELCETVLRSIKYHDTPEQRRDRFEFNMLMGRTPATRQAA